MLTSTENRRTSFFDIPRYRQAAPTAWPKDQDESSRTEEATAASLLVSDAGEEKPAAFAASAYTLRLHIDFLRRRIADGAAAGDHDVAANAPE